MSGGLHAFFKMRRLLVFILTAAVLIHMTCGNACAEGTKTAMSYKIYVNRAYNCITIVAVGSDGSENPVKSMICSCAREGYDTPAGTFSTSDYYKWRQLTDGAYGRYAIRINGDILLHSVPYFKASPDTLEWDQYNLLGTGASRGCVRMALRDIKWIYNNCRRGTTVVVHDDPESPGPLGCPEPIRFASDNPCRDWDPTDTDPKNPWLTYNPYGVTYYTFDAEKYAAKNPDVAEALGTSKGALWNHYISYGRFEGRAI